MKSHLQPPISRILSLKPNKQILYTLKCSTELSYVFNAINSFIKVVYHEMYHIQTYKDELPHMSFSKAFFELYFL